jgi:hypothetical protein
LEESAATLEESAAILEESALTLEESAALVAEESVAEVLALLLQAAKAAIAATNKNFFICDCFLCLLNGSLVNTTAEKKET